MMSDLGKRSTLQASVSDERIRHSNSSRSTRKSLLKGLVLKICLVSGGFTNVFDARLNGYDKFRECNRVCVKTIHTTCGVLHLTYV